MGQSSCEQDHLIQPHIKQNFRLDTGPPHENGAIIPFFLVMPDLYTRMSASPQDCSMSNVYGLRWSERPLFGTQALKWSVEPDQNAIGHIVRTELEISTGTKVDVAFLADGCFNKIYKVCADGQAFVLRVSLPLFAPLKVDSEVATSCFIRKVVSDRENRRTGNASDLSVASPCAQDIRL